MPVIISDEYLELADIREEELTLEIALLLYQKGNISLGKAAQLAGISRFAFQKEMASRKIPINFRLQDLQEDLKNLQSLTH